MTVYILSEVWFYQGSDIVEVFASRERAMEYVEPRLADKNKHVHREYELFEVWDFDIWAWELRSMKVIA